MKKFLLINDFDSNFDDMSEQDIRNQFETLKDKIDSILNNDIHLLDNNDDFDDIINDLRNLMIDAKIYEMPDIIAESYILLHELNIHDTRDLSLVAEFIEDLIFSPNHTLGVECIKILLEEKQFRNADFEISKIFPIIHNTTQFNIIKEVLLDLHNDGFLKIESLFEIIEYRLKFAIETFNWDLVLEICKFATKSKDNLVSPITIPDSQKLEFKENILLRAKEFIERIGGILPVNIIFSEPICNSSDESLFLFEHFLKGRVDRLLVRYMYEKLVQNQYDQTKQLSNFILLLNLGLKYRVINNIDISSLINKFTGNKSNDLARSLYELFNLSVGEN